MLKKEIIGFNKNLLIAEKLSWKLNLLFPKREIKKERFLTEKQAEINSKNFIDYCNVNNINLIEYENWKNHISNELKKIKGYE